MLSFWDLACWIRHIYHHVIIAVAINSMDVANDIFSTSTLCLPAIIEPNILLLGVWGQDQAHLRSFNVSGPRAPYTDAQRSAMRSLSLISKTNVNYFNDTIGLIMVNFAICIYIYIYVWLAISPRFQSAKISIMCCNLCIFSVCRGAGVFL